MWRRRVGCSGNQGGLWSIFKNSGTDVLVKEMTSNVFVPEHAMRIHLADQLKEILEPRIQLTEAFRTECMLFGPVRTATMSRDNRLKALEITAIRYRKIIWSS